MSNSGAGNPEQAGIRDVLDEKRRSELHFHASLHAIIFNRNRQVSFPPSTMSASPRDFYYSNKYNDDKYEYRHVHIPKDLVRHVPKDRLMSEKEWRSLGIQQSQGWVHYMIHSPERHVLLFRRPLKDTVCGENNGYVKEQGTKMC